MNSPMNNRTQIERASEKVIRDVLRHVERRGELCVIKAPPGSGKTYTLLQAVVHAINRGDRVAVATQTNAQSDDICRRLIRESRGLQICRFGAKGSSAPADLDGRVIWETDKNRLPTAECVVVATTAKWSLVELEQAFDVLFVDEAWQMAWGDFMLLQQVAPRFILIGDPGQIPPVVTIPVHRWETSPRAPHIPAPQLILLDNDIPNLLALDLPCCRRLPADSVDLVRPFYDFDFRAWARPGERFVKVTRAPKFDVVDPVIDLLRSGSTAIATLPTPNDGPPLEQDDEIATLTIRIAKRILQRGAVAAYDDDGRGRKLKPADIGISATHRVMNSAILRRLPADIRDQDSGIRVDTPERWQGLERKLMIVVHPLSGVVQPSAFDLETGRLCVMASRHRSGMIIVSRDHVPMTLDTHIPTAEQALGRPDVTGRGHSLNLRFWETLAKHNRVVAC
jgi:hypothetical protein